MTTNAPDPILHNALPPPNPNSPTPQTTPRHHAGKNQMFELGPGAQIKAMLKRIDPAAWGQFKNVAA